MNQKTTEVFIKQAKLVHNERYSYDKVYYEHSDRNVEITCSEHGSFFQRPYKHLAGSGCRKCAYNLLSEKKSMGTEEFVRRAFEVHGDKYNYSQVIYISNKKNVLISCPVHGKFSQIPALHLRGSGCMACSNKKTDRKIKPYQGFSLKKTGTGQTGKKIEVLCEKHGPFFVKRKRSLRKTDCPGCKADGIAEKLAQKLGRFIREADKVHDGRYDYSQTKYISSTAPVKISCKLHGFFKIRPHNHVRGLGCPVCNKRKPVRTLEAFITTANKIHQGRYSYECSDYKGSIKEIRINCQEHGPFLDKPYHHLLGRKCPGCSKDTSANHRKERSDLFFKRARTKFGDEYSYEKSKYVSSSIHIEFVCKKHGSFWKCPGDFLSKGCPKCSKMRSRLDWKSFTRNAKEKHGDKYDYSKVSYQKLRIPVEIICPEHGSFEQLPAVHLQGKGCRKCGAESSLLSTKEFIQKVTKVHGNIWSYEKSDYMGWTKTVEIGCKKHGYFMIQAKLHLNGTGCKLCGKETDRQKREDKFLEHVRLIHKNKYVYDNMNYVDSKKKIIVTCPLHGYFNISPRNHKAGTGCQFCRSLKT